MHVRVVEPVVVILVSLEAIVKGELNLGQNA